MRYFKHRLFQYMKYFWRAQTIYDVHSPFLYEFLTYTTDVDRLYYQFQELDSLRLNLFSDFTIIDDQDPGAGSHIKTNQLMVCDVAKTAISSQKKCEWLYRVMLHLQPKTVLELGASLGISSLYMAAPIKSGKVYTLEGRSSIAKCAQKTINRSSHDNIILVEGLFEETLDRVLNDLDEIDFVVLDGNHSYGPTMNYVEDILRHHQPKVILVDDIYWSPEMTRAWSELKKIDAFNVSIDFYDYGLLIHRPEIADRIDLSYIEYYKKIWRMGFFQ